MKEKRFDGDALEALRERPWPGNVRELRNVVERMAILGDDVLGLDDLPEEGRLAHQARAANLSEPPPSIAPPAMPNGSGRPTLKEFREHAERQYILTTLDECDWNISRAALQLGVERTNLHKKMRSYGIRREST